MSQLAATQPLPSADMFRVKSSLGVDTPNRQYTSPINLDGLQAHDGDTMTTLRYVPGV